MAELKPEIWKESFKWQYEAYPVYTTAYIRLAEKRDNKYFLQWENFINFFENGHLTGFLPNYSMLEHGHRIIQEILDGDDSFFEELQNVHYAMKSAIEKCLSYRAKKQFNKIDEWWPVAQQSLTDSAAILFSFDFALEDFFKTLQKENPSDFQSTQKHIVATEPSFFDVAKKELRELGEKYPNDFEKILPIFKEKFGWIQNSYIGKNPITTEWLKHFAKESSLKHQNESEPLESLPSKYKLLVDIAKEAVSFRDNKKKLLLIAIDLMHPWLESVANLQSVKYEELRWLTMDEVMQSIKNKENKCFEKASQYQKQNFRAGMMTPTDYDDIDVEIKNEILKVRETEIKLREIPGIIASRGKVTGKAKVILDPKKDGIKFNDGDILVTSMTRPEFMYLMKKAAAFVTDEGGITCHAAIVSREMGKPCIIATKIATKILKDGDLVEVDADKGIVKIIKPS